MSKDVAGATLMAAASSSPELFINTVGTFVTEGDLGIGTIVGSGVFNILAVPACCGLFAGKCLPMDWWPLTRDSIAYGIAVILLIFILADEKVSWQEAATLVACYIIYTLIMYFNESLKKCIKKCSDRLWATNTDEEQLLVKDESKHSDGHAVAGISLEGDAMDEFHEDEDEEVDLWHWPSSKGLAAQGYWILVWPISLLLYLTIPDCRQPSNHRLYPITFAMCILYIASSAYLVAWMITAIGDTARIPDSVMGLTLLAAGTSLPEAVSSVIVTNQGYGAMGLSNSLGSNTFDILVCLGLPWLLKSLVIPVKPGSHYVLINSKGIQYSAISLLSALLILYILFACNKFKIDRKIGFLCLLTYISFVTVATLNELNFFQVVNLPTFSPELGNISRVGAKIEGESLV
ncbi:sodium/potassium/calcium exchanger 3-like [Hetaerina americana]|uniref:sodium/potassium/calcium exchanger 3-like n=1 Tax=Hetaerina americana TaxID=62018 RepID=UPI003A7F4300